MTGGGVTVIQHWGAVVSVIVVALGGVVISMLATGQKICRLKPGQG
jgi:uncharacterized integral membrane protein